MVNDLLVPVTHTLPDGFRPEEEMASSLVNFFVSKMDKILDSFKEDPCLLKSRLFSQACSRSLPLSKSLM